ncbi:MAG: methylmalonyl-CoA epimerase [Acidobacteriota bacterium]|jgi:methylmalonyl-CoA/ethylmalonyl-CoA epimerase
MSFIAPGPIDHVGIAVRDIDAAAERYRELLGARVIHREKVTGQGVEVAFLEMPGATRVELIAPLDDGSPVARFLAKRGEGMHHICVLVEDIDTTLARLGEEEVPLVDAAPRSGAEGARIAFLHPAALGGVLLELKQKAG